MRAFANILPGRTIGWRVTRSALLPVIALIVALMIIGVSVSDRFGTARNLWNVYEQSTGLALVSLGQTMVILTGGIDVSVGSMISLLSELISGSIDGDATLVLRPRRRHCARRASWRDQRSVHRSAARSPAHRHARHRGGAARADTALFEPPARQSAGRV